MKSVPASAALAAALLVAPVALAVDSPVLDMTLQPTGVGWTQFLSGGGTGGVFANQLVLHSPTGGFTGYGAPASLWPAAAADPAGWSIEARVMLDSQTTDNAFFGDLLLLAGDGTYLHYFEIFADHVAITQAAYSGTTSFAMNTMDQVHTYVFSGLGAAVSVSVDGSPVIACTALAASPGPNFFEFGDLIFPNASDSHWTYVAFGAAPAPGASAVLLGGAMFLGRRRR